MLKKKIFTPGPTQVHPEVLKATISSDAYHRSIEFREFHSKLLSNLKKIFLTNQNINILTTSGTGGLEAAVLNFCKPSDNVLFINQGRFGARWGSIAKAHGFKTSELTIPYGEAATIEDLAKIDLQNVNAVLLTHSETSTATLTDIAALTAQIKKNSDAIVIADAVTSVGAIEFRMDEWKVDVTVSASQKGFMTQPGLAMIAYNDKAKELMLSNPSRRFFFDLRKEVESQKDNYTTWTPAVGLFFGLGKACDIILAEGMENVWKKTHEMAEYFRKGSLKNGLGIFSKSPTDSLTAITLPDNVPTGVLIKRMKENYGVQIANGQAELKDKIARFSHMGDLELADFELLNELLRKEFEIIRSGK